MTYSLSEDCAKPLKNIIDDIVQSEPSTFGNARAMRNVFEQTVQQHSNRVVGLDNPTTEQLQQLTAADIPALTSA